MYTLYDVFVNKNSIVKSIGLEYNDLDYESCILILISNMKYYNLLDNNSNSVVSDKQFYELLSSVGHNKEYKDMYFLDAILILLNSQASISLVMLYGSEKAKNDIINGDIVLVSNDVLKIILLDQTDLNTITSLYNTTSYYRSLLDDPNILSQLISNITLKLKHLPGHTRYKNSSLNKRSNITFNKFVDWYKREFYYVKDCENYDTPLICYSGARDKGDNVGAKKYLNLILSSDWFDIENLNDVKEVPPRYLADIINTDPRVRRDKARVYTLLTESLLGYPKYYELTEKDIKAYSSLISYVKDEFYEEDMVSEYNETIMVNSLNDPRLFNLLINLRVRDGIDVIIGATLYGIQNQVNDITEKLKYYIKFIEYAGGKIDDTGRYLRNYFSNRPSPNGSTNIEDIIAIKDDLLDSNPNYLDYLTELLDLLSKYIGRSTLTDLLRPITRSIGQYNVFSVMTNFITNYTR